MISPKGRIEGMVASPGQALKDKGLEYTIPGGGRIRWEPMGWESS